MAFFGDCFCWQLILVVLLLLVPIFYQLSQTFKYYIKLIVYFSAMMVIAFGVILYSIPRPRNPKNHFFVSFWVTRVLSPLMGVEVIIRGQENLKRDDPLIIVINHQSSIDMLPLFAIWPDNCVILAKKELIWTSGTFGLGAWMCGTVYINRVNTKSARRTMDSTSAQIQNRRLKVAVFPEGTRNHLGSLLPFKKGAFHLAVEGQVPIVPVVISSYNHFYSKVDKRFNEGKVIIEILPAIPTAGLEPADVTALSESTREIMLKHFDKISQEVLTLR